MLKSTRYSRPSGFTLLEVLVTMTVLGILVSIAIPSFGYLAANTKVKAAATDLHLSLLKARSEAVKRSGAITVTATSGTNWAGGWTIAAGADILSVQEAMGGVKITPDPSPTATLVFLSTGRTQNGSSPQFDLDPKDSQSVDISRCVSLQANGAPYVKEGSC